MENNNAIYKNVKIKQLRKVCSCIMRILFNCNTYYQLIVAIQLRITEFKADEVILCLSDHSQNAKKVVENMIRSKIFSEVYLINKYEKSIAKKSMSDRVQQCKRMLCGSKTYDFGKVDLLMYYNLDDFFVYEVFSSLKKANKSLKCCRFEESYISYNSTNDFFYPTIKIINMFLRILHKKTLLDATEAFYCYKPKGYLGELPIERIPSFNQNTNEIRKAMKETFDIDDTCLQYNQKYIFFTSVFDFEGGTAVGEYELVCKVAELVGKDNLLVKTHPRDRRNIYLMNGFNVDKRSSIPWEAIQLNGNFEGHILLALNSSSILLVTTNINNSPEVAYMYNCVEIKKNKLAIDSKKNTDILLNIMRNEEGFERVHVLNKIEEILDL